jgi:hypothetical protein
VPGQRTPIREVIPQDPPDHAAVGSARPCRCRASAAKQVDVAEIIRCMETVTLWRPTGSEELALVEASGWTAWPPRLPDQPIFYPVLNEEYATRIARDWNVKASGVGYVTRFKVDQDFLDRYEVQQVGGQTILEYWIPAQELADFNQHIIGRIEVVAEYR